jgi:hypothetical protein
VIALGGAPSGKSTTYIDTFAYFLRAIVLPSQSSFDQRLASECKFQTKDYPEATNLSGAILRNAVIRNAHLVFTNLSGADLSGAMLDGSQIQMAELKEAILRGSSLTHVTVTGSHIFHADLTGADLGSADLVDSDLNNSDLNDTKLDGANFHSSEVCGVNFEPANIPSSPRSLGFSRGLEMLKFRDQPTALNELRAMFRDSGFREQERKVTYAIKTHDAADYWKSCVLRDAPSCLEFGVNFFLFDLTCLYGMEPERPLRLLGRVWFYCSFLYFGFLLFSKRGGLYVVPSRFMKSDTSRHLKIRKLQPRSQPTRTGGIRKSWRWIKWTIQSLNLFPVALLFSTMSTFNISFKGADAGRWIRLIQKRPFDIEARGWPRVIAGLQAIASVGLLALWLLTSFGRPFG